MKELSHCPVCKNQSFSKYLELSDHFLSKEIFNLVHCDNCGLIFTNPRPLETDLSLYYKSEDYISHSNVKGGLINSLYHIVRQKTIQRKYKIVNQFSVSKNILDIGCGTGELLNHFQKNGWHITGIEPDDEARKYAVDNYAIPVSDLDSLQLDNQEKFSAITMWHVLEHIYDLHPYLEKIKSILAQNGTFIVAVPNSASWDALHYKSSWAAYDVPRHLYHFNQKSIDILMKMHHFNLVKTIPMKFDAYYISLLSEKYKTGKSHLLKGFLNGFYSNLSARLNQNNFSSLIFIYKNK